MTLYTVNPYAAVTMSFPQFDPSQGQASQFAEGNGNGAAPQQSAQQGMPQALGQDTGSPDPFQGQAGDAGSAGSASGGDAKTTLW